MPWKSKRQAAWGHTEAGKKALGGEEAVKEWDKASKGKDLPEKIEKAEMKKVGGMMQLGLGEKPSTKPVGPSVKIPRQKSMPNAFSKPSKFFKSEELCVPKHPTLMKLHDFLNNRLAKRQK